MANLKEENKRFREAFAKMSPEMKNKISGEENPRTPEQEKALAKETAEISAKIENRTQIYKRANAMLKLQMGTEIKDIIKSFKDGTLLFVDAKLLSDKEWQDLNDVLWMREFVQFVKYGDKMRLTQVAGPDRLKQEEEQFKRWHPNASAKEFVDAMHQAAKRDSDLHAQEMLMIQRSQERR